MKYLILLFASIAVMLGLYLLGAGIYLIALGGSWYYALYGAALLATVFFLKKNPFLSVLIMTVSALATLIWALAEVGANYWQLFPRLMVPVVAVQFAAFFLGFGFKGWQRIFSFSVAGMGFLFGVIFSAEGFITHPIVAPDPAEVQAFKKAPENTSPSDWTAYGRTNSGTRFAPFTAINRDTVKNLQLAWTAHTGDKIEGVRQDTPLQIGNNIYTRTPNDHVLALDADTGKTKWTFDSHGHTPVWQRCRGLGYYALPETKINNDKPCHERIFNSTTDARLIALDAKTGELCKDFGHQGVVDLKENMGKVPPGFYFQTSAPTISRGHIIIGGWVIDNVKREEPSGVIRAFNAQTGKLDWAWDMGHPDWHGLPPKGDTYTLGTPNMWSTAAADDKLGLVYIPLGNETPDYNSFNRNPVSAKYNSSIVALGVDTGIEKWSFQTVHHDIWDYDLPSQPALTDIPDGNGGTIPAVMQTTKRGQIFLLNRQTGKPLADVVEKPVPITGAVPGETLSPTQPYSVGMPTIGSEYLTESKMWGATNLDQLLCRIKFHKLAYQGDFSPAGLKPTIQQPSNIGGMNWGSVSYDPENALAIVNDVRIPNVFFQYPQSESEKIDKEYGKFGDGHTGSSPQLGTPFGVVTNLFLSPIGAPCTHPPFGTITAIDLKTHKIAWQIPAGSAKNLGPFGIPSHLPLKMGMPTYAGTITTAGGLVFHAGNMDFSLKAYDEATGKEVWSYQLPYGSSATPMSYVSPKTGKQYILLSVGGMNHLGPQGDLLMAFALKS